MVKPSQAPTPPRKSSKIIPLAVLGVLSVMVVGYCAAVNDDDDDVTADCVRVRDDTTQAGYGDFTPTPTPSASPSPTTSTSSPPAGSYEVVDDSYCDDSTRSYGGSHGAYLWYYGGHRVGTHVRNGTTLRPSDVTITSRSGKEIQRGGFGRSGTGGS